MNDRLQKLTPAWRDRVAAAVGHLEGAGLGGRVGLVLGSGLGNVVERVENPQAVAFADLPGFPTASVPGHAGRLVAGTLAGVPVVVLQGRVHGYEGQPWDLTLLPTAVLAGLGLEIVLLTNAAGGLSRYAHAGDLMVIGDHLDLHLADPLRGLLAAPLGAGAATDRVAGPHPIYDPDLVRLLAGAAAAAGIPAAVGTYASVWGPSYETRPEIGMLRRAGCDAVGMSTAPEAVLLRALGVRVCGLSCLTNVAHETGHVEVTHDEVIAVGREVRDRMGAVLLAFLERL